MVLFGFEAPPMLRWSLSAMWPLRKLLKLNMIKKYWTLWQPGNSAFSDQLSGNAESREVLSIVSIFLAWGYDLSENDFQFVGGRWMSRWKHWIWTYNKHKSESLSCVSHTLRLTKQEMTPKWKRPRVYIETTAGGTSIRKHSSEKLLIFMKHYSCHAGKWQVKTSVEVVVTSAAGLHCLWNS